VCGFVAQLAYSVVWVGGGALLFFR
jgi:hypothetical protein